MEALTWSFDTWSDRRELDRETPPLTVADPCIWHGSGTNLSRRKSATTAGALTDHARVCLAVPPPASATLPVPSIRASRTGRAVGHLVSAAPHSIPCVRGAVANTPELADGLVDAGLLFALDAVSTSHYCMGASEFFDVSDPVTGKRTDSIDASTKANILHSA